MMGRICKFLEKAFSFYSCGERIYLRHCVVLVTFYDALSAQRTKFLEELGNKEQISITTPRESDILLKKLEKYEFTIWSELSRVAQTLDPRISNAGLTSTQLINFRAMLDANYGYQNS